jgi:hypothetical protein
VLAWPLAASWLRRLQPKQMRFLSTDNPKYPLVSGWSENGAAALDYNQRGWTWSAEHNTWLQSEPGQANMSAELVHMRNEDDLTLTPGQ